MPHFRIDHSAASPSIRGFDFTSAMSGICRQIVDHTPELAHIDLSRVAISFCQARKSGNYGLFASLTPLRFAGGATTTVRRGRRYAIQQFRGVDGREYLYVLSFCLPRFADLCLREKLITIFHELWHISPRFDGDIRRHQGRCYAHTASQAQFDEAMGRLADRWLAQQPNDESWNFLRHSFAELQRLYGGLIGLRLPRPKLLPVPPSSALTG